MFLTISPRERPLESFHNAELKVPRSISVCEANDGLKEFRLGISTGDMRGAGHGPGEIVDKAWVSRIKESCLAHVEFVGVGEEVELQPPVEIICLFMTVPACSTLAGSLETDRCSQLPSTLFGRLADKVPEMFNLQRSERGMAVLPLNPPAR